MRRLGKNVLPLKIFVRQGQVLSLYRSLLRGTRYIDDSFVQKDLRDQIISGFKKNRTLEGDMQIAQAIKEANSHLSLLQDMSKRRDMTDESWIRSSSDGDERGRVGSGWPWKN